MTDRERQPAHLLLAADIGNSKTDLVLAAPDGTIVAAVRGGTASHQQIGFERGEAVLLELAARAQTEAGLDPSDRPIADLAMVCAAGADFADEIRRLARRFETLGIGRRVIVRNDTDAALRAGAPDGWGVAVICGAGINAIARSPGGHEARYPSLGSISGDWGGGLGLGSAALFAAVRARDGRGPRTSLEQLVPARFGLRRPLDVTMAIYRERLPRERLVDLAPDIFAAAATDTVARELVDRLANEVVTMAVATMRRAGILRRRPPVVLAGGIFRTDSARFHERIRAGIEAAAPGAAIDRLTVPPIVGAGLLALDAVTPGGIATLSAAVALRTSLPEL
jgi:N-acetylglucosamine kinase-like BadF-type ATPase